MKRALILGMVICMTLMAGIAWSADLYVPGDYSNIQSAINAAETGDTVLVADGIYTGVGNKNIDFGGKALTVRSANGPGNCIIDCEGSGRGFYFYKGKGNPVVQGFTITGGVADNGGGIYCYSSSPTITNCTISGNSATNSTTNNGGGIYCYSSSPTITNCTISGNSADSGFGGGIYCESSSTTITDCTISGNSAFAGGGIFCYPGATIITNCTINGNSVIYYGGGIFCGYSSPLITNCTISGNRTDYSGGGIHHFGSDATITNSILWNDTPNEITFSENNPIVKYSDVQGGWVGEGNIDQDPKFVSSNDYHLQKGSPCIDAGTTAGAPPFDKEGNPRVGNPDMGAYEYQVDTTPPMMLLNDPSPSVLWPPNHKFVDVTITGEVFDFCDPELYIGVSVAVIDAEGRSGGPDYNLLEARIDASGNIYILVSLRAERSGTNSGRTYEVTVTVTDDSGNSTSKAVQVIVPHDQGKKK
ncbi:MAG: hypothetical protein QG588_1047 [Candidatus Poribacteria bacterium]|nr:hypothetical protein [Candidatus Poribacteria bacterium]